jgi:phosphate transport system permease protein
MSGPTLTSSPPLDAEFVAPVEDRPRAISPGLTTGDYVFRRGSAAVGVTVLAITGAIGLFLGYQSIPTMQRYGLHFFVESDWQPERDVVGISSVLLGTVQVAFLALIMAFPLALATALFITEYAPVKIRSALVSLIDLMAAIPSIVWGLWGFFLIQPHAIGVARWLAQHMSWVPFFHVDTDPGAALWAQTRFTASVFIASFPVAMMILPMAAAVMRGVFAQAPPAEREAALALGGTQWGAIRTVVLPFGRGGIIGGTMLALGRALGETIAVLLIISPAFDLKIRPLEVGTETVSALIAGRFGEATSSQLSALLTAGFVLFLLTLLVNTMAAVFVNRSRSGSAPEI